MDQSILVAVIDRPLSDADIALLVTEPRSTKAPSLTRLTERHHRLARMIAEGIPLQEAGIACGYISSRVSSLNNDPAFKDLIKFYGVQVNAHYLELQERLGHIAADAADILSNRLEETPEDFDTSDLMKLVALGADRTGHGPSSTQNTNVNVNFGARLDAARERIRLKTIEDATVVEVKDVKQS
jgi:hypothetical protein